MKLEEYKAGEYKQGNGYKVFSPSCINYNWGWDDTKLDSLLAEANRQIGELNAYSLLLPNVDLYIKMIGKRSKIMLKQPIMVYNE